MFKDNTPKTSHLTITVKLYSKDHNGIMQFGKEPEDFGYNTLFDLEIVNKDTGVSYKPQHLGAKGFARAYSFLKIPEGVYTVKVNNYSDLYKMTTVLPTDINVPHGNTYSIEFRKLYNVSYETDPVMGTIKPEDSYSVEYNRRVQTDQIPTVTANRNYKFEGWSLDGVNIVNPKNVPIVDDTVFKAVYSKLADFVTIIEINSDSHKGIMQFGKEPADFDYANLGLFITNNATGKKYYPQLKGKDGFSRAYSFLQVPAGNYTVDISKFSPLYKLMSPTLPGNASAPYNNSYLIVFNKLYDVNYQVDNAKGDLVGTTPAQFAYNDTLTNIPTITNKGNYEFVGWSTDGTTVIDISNYKVVNNVTFIAVFKEKSIMPTPVPTPTPSPKPVTPTSTSNVTPVPGRTCQDDGYPAGYTWDDAKQACVLTGTNKYKVPNTSETNTLIQYVGVSLTSLLGLLLLKNRK